MADAEIPGAKELSDWYTEAIKTDGDVSALLQLSKWLDDGAEDMMMKVKLMVQVLRHGLRTFMIQLLEEKVEMRLVSTKHQKGLKG